MIEVNELHRLVFIGNNFGGNWFFVCVDFSVIFNNILPRDKTKHFVDQKVCFYAISFIVCKKILIVYRKLSILRQTFLWERL